MDDAGAVGDADGFSDRDSEVEQPIERETSGADSRTEWLAVDQLHGQTRHPLDFFDRIDGDDVGVIECGDGKRFAFETPATVGAVDLQDLERDVTVQAHIPRTIDPAHPACSEQADDFVMPNAGTGSQGHETADYSRFGYTRSG